MKRARLTLASLLVMLGIIGTAFAIFTFSEAAKDEKDFGIDVAKYIYYGTVEITEVPASYEIDQTLETFQIKFVHTLPEASDSNNQYTGNPVYNVEVGYTGCDLSDYLEFETELAYNTDVEGEVTVTVTVTVKWVVDPETGSACPANPTEWTALSEEAAKGNMLVTVTVTDQ